MSPLYIQNHDTGRLVLRYDLDTGRFAEIPADMRPEGTKLARGFYVAADGKFTGVHASSQGPVLFCNELCFCLQKPGYRIEVSEAAGANEFRLLQNVQCLVQVRYSAPEPTGNPFWPEDEKEFSDFFLWLKSGMSQAQFFRYYTQPE